MSETLNPPRSSVDLLASFVDAGVLTEGEARLARRLGHIGGDDDPHVLLAAALALRAPRLGHVCIELDRISERVGVEPRTPRRGGVDDDPDADEPTLDWPDPTAWTAAIEASPLARNGGPGETPLVLDHGRLYLDRYWVYEQRLADELNRRAAERTGDTDPASLRRWLDELFGPAEGLDRQRLAAAMAVQRRLSVIAGGPGTGKTHTVTRILALLHLHAIERDPERPLRAALAAPTGKAAARLQESMREGLARMDLDPELRSTLEHTPALTLHRLLGSRRDSSSRFRHDASSPLPHDVVIVDEASMVSLPLMAKLLDAVRPDARLILLGDRDQLASVEAGAAFGDICGPDGSRPVLRRSQAAINELEDVLGSDVAPGVTVVDSPGVWDAIVHLDRFHRFDEASEIGAVAAAIQRADDRADDALALISAPPAAAGSGVRLLDPDETATARAGCERDVVDAYAEYVQLALDGAEPSRVLEALGDFRVLCALRAGPDGAWDWNRNIETRLERAVPGFRTDEPWYVGRPILVTENDYSVRLYNGDVGVILADPDREGRRLAAFPAADGSIRLLSPARLPACETTFAMTIHKSQGSQFAHVVVALPGVPSPVLTREMVYTAITRASQSTTLLARLPILTEALSRRVQRASGLQSRLWST